MIEEKWWHPIAFGFVLIFWVMPQIAYQEIKADILYLLKKGPKPENWDEDWYP